MYADQTLTPKESIRLAALGTLALEPSTYSGLAVSIRHFIGHVTGPTPDLMGHSIELLKYEGLVESIDGNGDTALLRLTEAGRAELTRLLTAKVRAADNGVTKLVVALKFRFLHLLDPVEQRAQTDLLADVCEQELSRLVDLRAHHADGAGHLVEWLDHDIGQLETRLAWLTAFRDRLPDA